MRRAIALLCFALLASGCRTKEEKPAVDDAVRASARAEHSSLELTIENHGGVDLYIPDVRFRANPRALEIDRDALEVAEGDGTMHVELLVKPLDPNTTFATPPTFHTHVIKAGSTYHRRWPLPHAPRRGVVVRIGLVRSTPPAPAKDVLVDGETLSVFGYNALASQMFRDAFATAAP